MNRSSKRNPLWLLLGFERCRPGDVEQEAPVETHRPDHHQAKDHHENVLVALPADHITQLQDAGLAVGMSVAHEGEESLGGHGMKGAHAPEGSMTAGEAQQMWPSGALIPRSSTATSSKTQRATVLDITVNPIWKIWPAVLLILEFSK